MLRNRSLWVASFALWSVAASFNASSELVDVLRGERVAALWEPVLWELSSNYTWAALSPFIVAFTLRSFARLGWTAAFAMHVPVMIGFSVVHVAGMVAIRYVVYSAVGGAYDPGELSLGFLYELFKDVGTFWTVVALAHGWTYYRKFQERDLRAAQLERQLAQARLESLQQRLHPHFLFNTLNTVSAIMHEDVARADRILSRLGDLLRLALETSERVEVPLSEEVAAVKLYVEILEERFRDRLSVEVSTPPDVSDALVPAMILQPLVENAVKHAVAPRPSGGRIWVEASRGDGRLRLEVRDDGPGADVEGGALLGRGFGLASTAERLRELYGDGQSFDLGRAPEGGLAARIEIPYHEEPV